VDRHHFADQEQFVASIGHRLGDEFFDAPLPVQLSRIDMRQPKIDARAQRCDRTLGVIVFHLPSALPEYGHGSPRRSKRAF
jgi:hypothetical protein